MHQHLFAPTNTAITAEHHTHTPTHTHTHPPTLIEGMALKASIASAAVCITKHGYHSRASHTHSHTHTLFEWMALKSSVASAPVAMRMESAPPGWSSKKGVASYTLPS